MAAATLAVTKSGRKKNLAIRRHSRRVAGDVDDFKVRLLGKKQMAQREKIGVTMHNKRSDALHLADMQMEAVILLLISRVLT